MKSKVLISVVIALALGVAVYAESPQYAVRKRTSPAQNAQDSTNHIKRRVDSPNRASNQNTRAARQTRNAMQGKAMTSAKGASATSATGATKATSATSAKSLSAKSATSATRASDSTRLMRVSESTSNPSARAINRANATRNLSSRNLSTVAQSAQKSVSATSATSAMGSSVAQGLSNTAITLSSLGGTALAGGLGGGIYALVKKDKDEATQNAYDMRNFQYGTINIGVVDSGYNPSQIAQPSKNFYNLGYTPPKDDPGHGTNVAKAIRAYNMESPMYMYSARCYERAICINTAMYNALYQHDARVINGSFGRLTDANSANISVGILNDYYSDWNYYGMAKEAATRRIFVFAAGNDAKLHTNIQGAIPLVGTKSQKRLNQFDIKIWENSKRGWIAVTSTYWGNNLLDTRYANWIGEESQNWGIATKPYGGTGTSYSAPVVTAAAANVWNHFPWMSNHLVTQTILSTADKYTINESNDNYYGTGDKWHANQVTDGPNKKTGWGVLNQTRALKGPARFDKRLLVPDDGGKVQVYFDTQYYADLNRLTFGNDIAGDAGLRKGGSGVLYMSGKNTYTGETQIDGGVLVVSNALTDSKITIGADGRLRAQNLDFLPSDSKQPNFVTLGTANKGYTLTNSGYFEVFKDTTLNGDYISKGNSTLALDVDAKLSVNGSVDMSGGKLSVHSLSRIPSTSYQTKTLLTAQSGVKQWNGKWSVSQLSSAFLSVSEVKLTNAQNTNTKNDLSVTYKRDSTSDVVARAMGGTPQNLQNVGRGIDAVLDSLADARDADFDKSLAESNANFEVDSSMYAEALSLMATTQQDAPAVISSISGEIYDSNLSVTHKSAVLLNRTIARRLYQIGDSANSGVWADASYAKSNLRADGFAEGKITQYAIMAGIDGSKADKDSSFGGGVLFSVDRAKGDFGVVGKSDMLSYGISLYGAVSYKRFYALARIGETMRNTDITRRLNFGTMASLQNKQKDMSYHGYIEVGYNLDAGWFRLTPFVAWEEDFITRKKVQESGKDNNGSNFALVLDSAKYRVYSLIYGAKGYLKFGQFALEYSALDMFAPKPNDFRSNARFSGAQNGEKFTSAGIPQAKNLVFVSLGASYAFSNLVLRGEYSVSINPKNTKKIEDEVVNLNLRYNF